MPFGFRPAAREGVGLIIGLSGPSGSGKTMSALKLATGLAGGKPFALVDTEAGRAKHYADQFKFDHGDLHAPFTPDAYAEAIKAADDAGYPVVVVDSTSHYWSGEGGVLDWQEAELTRMAGTDWKKREACKMASWVQPKIAAKKMVTRLLQLRSHIILCFRAEEKIEMVRGEGGKLEVRPKQTLTSIMGYVPICSKELPYELTLSVLFTPDAPGVPKPIKLQAQHKQMVPLDRPMDESVGQALAAWAAGAPTDQSTRAELLQKIKRAADTMNLGEGDRSNLRETCKRADMDGLARIADDLMARAMEAAS